MMLSLVAPSLGEDSVAPPCIPAMQLVGLRSCLAFLTLSTVGAPSGAPALLREAQWVIGHGLSSELPTQLSGPRPASASGLGVGVHLLSSCLKPQP